MLVRGMALSRTAACSQGPRSLSKEFLMKALDQAVLARIYTDEDALIGDRPLYATLVARAHAAKLAGATVLRGRMGFGQSAVVHAHHTLDLRDNLPMVIEIVDEEPKLRAFIADLGDLQGIGLITVEKVEVVRYGARDEPTPNGH